MKNEKKIATLSIIAVVLGIMAILAITYTPLIAEAQNTPSSFPNFSTSNVDNLTDEKLEDAAWENFAIPYFMDGKLSHVVVPSRETDFFYGEKSLTLMPIEEFYEIYGTNATIHGLDFWMP